MHGDEAKDAWMPGRGTGKKLGRNKRIQPRARIREMGEWSAKRVGGMGLIREV